jgi:hypothetical protein
MFRLALVSTWPHEIEMAKNGILTKFETGQMYFDRRYGSG